MNRLSLRDGIRRGMVRTRRRRGRHREDGVADLEAEAVVLYLYVSFLLDNSFQAALESPENAMSSRIFGFSNL